VSLTGETSQSRGIPRMSAAVAGAARLGGLCSRERSLAAASWSMAAVRAQYLTSRGAAASAELSLARQGPAFASVTLGVRRFRSSTVARGLKAGIVGLPNVGKSTLFNALTESKGAQAENFPFCTIEPNVGVVTVPDERLHTLAKISNSKSVVAATVEFVDIAGLVKGASKGEGLGNQFLADIRETDCIVQVVRCFDDDQVIHVDGRVDPVQDTDVINFELAISDFAQIERRLERLGKSKGKVDAKLAEVERGALERIMASLEGGRPARSVELNEDERAVVTHLNLLTMKPMIYAANVPEEDLASQGADNRHVKALKAKASEERCEVVVVSARVEAELVDLDAAERVEYLSALGVEEGGLNALVQAAYRTLGLQTYFTTGEKETRAWTIRQGFTAPQAAGVIHSDFEKGFIRAETIAFQDFIECGGEKGAKDKGKMRLEGKEYVVQEADVLLFRFAN